MIWPEWSAEEDDLLAKLQPHLIHQDIAALMGRTKQAVDSRVKALGLSTMTPWTKEDDKLMIEISPYLTRDQMAELMGCGPDTVRRRAIQLGMRRGRYRAQDTWTPEEDAALRSLYTHHRNSDIAVLLGRSKKSVETAASRRGLRKHATDFHRPLLPPGLREVVQLTNQLKEMIDAS